MQRYFWVLMCVCLASGSRVGPHGAWHATSQSNAARAQCDLMGSDEPAKLNLLGLEMSSDSRLALHPRPNISASVAGAAVGIGFRDLRTSVNPYMGVWVGVTCSASGTSLADLHAEMLVLDVENSFKSLREKYSALAREVPVLSTEDTFQEGLQDVVKEASSFIADFIRRLTIGGQVSYTFVDEKPYQLSITVDGGVGVDVEVRLGLLIGYFSKAGYKWMTSKDGYLYGGGGVGVGATGVIAIKANVGYNDKTHLMKIIFRLSNFLFEYTLPMIRMTKTQQEESEHVKKNAMPKEELSEGDIQSSQISMYR